VTLLTGIHCICNKIKSRRMSWDGLVALVGEEEKKKNGYRVLL
jgi:hypothetical protein